MKRLGSGFLSGLSRKGTTRNFLTLVSGTTVAQTFSLIFYPMLGRLFSPEEFGLLSVLSTVSAIIVVIASGKYEQAIIVTKDRHEAINVLTMTLLCSAGMCSLIAAAMYFCSEPVLDGVNQRFLKGWIYVSPITAFFIIVYNSFNEWCVKKGSFSVLATNKITNSASISGSKFMFGFIGAGGGLVFGELLGRGLSAMSCVIHWVRIDKDDFKNISWDYLKKMALKYIDFPKFTMPDQILNTFTGSLSVFFLASYFGKESLGYYSMTQNVLAIPSVFVGQAVMDVFRNRASSDFELRGNCRGLYMKLLKRLVPPIAVACGGVIYFLPSVFSIVLGEQWREAGKFAQILTPAIAMNFLHNTFASVWIIAGKLKQRLCWQIFYFGVILSSMLAGCIVFNDVRIAVCCLSAGLTISYGTSLYFTWLFSRGTVRYDG